MIQGDLFGAPAAPSYRPDTDKVRARLYKLLAEARSATAWEPARASLYRVIFPQMSRWLPDNEAAQLRVEFDAAIAVKIID